MADDSPSVPPAAPRRTDLAPVHGTMVGVPTSLLVPLTVVVGEEDLLVARAVSAVVRAARELDPEVDVRDVGAGRAGAR